MKLENIQYSYDINNQKNSLALNNVSLEIDETKITGITGNSGSGKSTFLQILNTLIKPTSGKYLLDNQTIEKHSKNKELIDIKKRNALVFQFSEVQFFEKTIEEDFKFTFKNFNLDYDTKKGELEGFLRKFKLPVDILKQNPQTLSGGEKKKLAIISGLILKPKVLLLDEPTIGIDVEFKKELLNILKEENISGLGIVIASHDIDFLNEIAEEIVEIKNGKVGFDGSKNDYVHYKYDMGDIEELPELYKYAKHLKLNYIENLTLDRIALEINSRVNDNV